MNQKIDIIQLLIDKEIFLADYDILNSINNEELRDVYYNSLIIGHESSNEEKFNFIKNNIDFINQEKLILYSIRNKLSEIDILNERLIKQKNIKSRIDKKDLVQSLSVNVTLNTIAERIVKSKKDLEKLKKLVKNSNICVATEYYNQSINKPEVEVLDAKSLVTGRSSNKKKNTEKFQMLVNSLTNIKYEDFDGLTAFSNIVPLSEIIGIFPDNDFNSTIFNYALNMHIWSNGITDEKQIENERSKGVECYDKFLKDKEEFFVSDVVFPTISSFVEFADIDKLAMRGAYRTYEALETKATTQTDIVVLKEIQKVLYKYCKQFKIPSNYKLELNAQSNSWENTFELPFSPEDIKRCLKKFYKGEYLDLKKIKNIHKSVVEGNLYFSQIPSDLIDVLYTETAYKEIMFLNNKNFNDIIKMKNLSNEEVLKIAEERGFSSSNDLKLLLENNIITMSEVASLYMEDKISESIILELIKDDNNEKSINFEELINYYEQSKKDDSNKEIYLKYLRLCKDIIGEKNISESFMEYYAENYNPARREKYINELEHFYKEGLIDIKSIINWENESIVARFLNDKIIDSTIIKELMQSGAISTKYAQSLFGECILDPNMPNEARLNLIKSKLISEEYIGKAYQANLIPTSLADELSEEGFFEKSKYDNISIDELQENAAYKLGDLRGLSKFRNQFGNNGNSGYYYFRNKNSFLIDPNAREDLFELLKAKRAVSTEIQPSDPFYNYEFYVLPSTNGVYGPNSVIIAERYYTNKDTMKTFATDNATYFFKWKDLLYMSNLKKSEVNKASKDIVFRASHVVSDGKDKEGSWANSVLTAIGKTMMGREIRKYSKDKAKIEAIERLKKLYTSAEWDKIENKKIDIDCGLCSFKNPSAPNYSGENR